MNQQKFGVRLWLWIALGVAILIGLGYAIWSYSGGKTTTTITSPSPTAVTSPTGETSPTPIPTGTGGTVGTPTPTTIPTVETKNWNDTLGPTEISCVPKITFNYPVNFVVAAEGGTPMVGQAKWLNIYQQGQERSEFTNNWIRIAAASYTAQTNYSPITCVDPSYENLTDYATRNDVTDYSPLTINGKQAIQFIDASSKKVVAIMNDDKNVVTISINPDSSYSTVFDIIANSFQFR